MALRFSPQWAKQNGDINGVVFNGWLHALKDLSVSAIHYGIAAVKNSGTQYAPNLNKFESLCRQTEANAQPGDSLSEQIHGGKLKPTPNGVPLTWTIGEYTTRELLESGNAEDAEMGEMLKREGITIWRHQSLDAA